MDLFIGHQEYPSVLCFYFLPVLQCGVRILHVDIEYIFSEVAIASAALWLIVSCVCARLWRCCLLGVVVLEGVLVNERILVLLEN